MSARRVAAALVVLAAAVGLWLLTEGRADAQGPFKVSDQITDATTVLGAPLSDSHRAAIGDGIAKLYATQGVRLWVVFVDDFSGQSPKDWAQVTWAASGLGGGDVLMAVSVSDRQSELLYPPSWVGDVRQQVHQVWARIEPEIGRGLFVSAAADTAYGLASLPVALPSTSRPGGVPSPSPWGSTADLLTRLAVGALAGLVAAFGLARGRPRGHWSHHRAIGGSLMVAGAVASLAHFPSSLAHRGLGVVLGVVALAAIAAAVWALIRFDLGALVRAAMIGGLGLAGVVIAFLVVPALAPLLLLGLAVWGLVWWLRGKRPAGGDRYKVGHVLPKRTAAKLGLRLIDPKDKDRDGKRRADKDEWNGRIDAHYDSDGYADRLSMILPLHKSPKELAGVWGAVCSDVLDNSWPCTPGAGNSMVATREEPDLPLLIPFKTVLREPRMLGPDAQVWASTDPSGKRVIELTARMSTVRAGELTRGGQTAFKKQFREKFPPGADQDWDFDFRPHCDELVIKRTMFPQVVPYLVPTVFMRTVDEAYRHYPQRVFPIGHDVRGRRIDWPIGEQVLVHTLIFGGVGAGKSADTAHLICESVAAGFATFLIDLKGSRTFARLSHLPNIALYARGVADGVRALSYVHRIMDWRYDDTGRIPRPAGAPPKNAPMAVFVDESQRLFLKEFERLYGKGAAEWLSLDTMGNCRDALIHFILNTQQVTSESLPSLLLRHTKSRHQWGPLDQYEAPVTWKRQEYVEASVSVPLVKGRGLVTDPKSPDGAPVLVQGIYVPGTSISKPLSAAERQHLDGVLAGLAAVPNLYERVVVDPHAGPPARDAYTDAWMAVGPPDSFAGEPAPSPENGETPSAPLYARAREETPTETLQRPSETLPETPQRPPESLPETPGEGSVAEALGAEVESELFELRAAQIYRETGKVAPVAKAMGIGWQTAAELLDRLGLRPLKRKDSDE